MNVIDELKQVIEVKIVIKEKELSDKLFDLAVDPLIIKLTELIPTDYDLALYTAKKEELRALFAELIAKGSDKLEDKIGIDLDGKPE